MIRGRCPYCGKNVAVRNGLTANHHEGGVPPRGKFVTNATACAGSRENPRGLDDRRPTWRHEERVGVKWDPWGDPNYDPDLWREEPAA